MITLCLSLCIELDQINVSFIVSDPMYSQGRAYGPGAKDGLIPTENLEG